MADFCSQCSIDTFGADYDDHKGHSTEQNTKDGLYCTVICEGCGIIQVNHLGECVSPDCLVDHATGNPRNIK